jgi:hypothetical protein
MIEISTKTRKAKPKTEFWRTTETNRLTRKAYKTSNADSANRSQNQTKQRQKPNYK